AQEIHVVILLAVRLRSNDSGPFNAAPRRWGSIPNGLSYKPSCWPAKAQSLVSSSSFINARVDLGDRQGRSVPIPGVSLWSSVRVQKLGLLDYLVGAGEQCCWNGQAQSLCGFRVNHEVELCRQHNREVGRLLAFQVPRPTRSGAMESSHTAQTNITRKRTRY